MASGQCLYLDHHGTTGLINVSPLSMYTRKDLDRGFDQGVFGTRQEDDQLNQNDNGPPCREIELLIPADVGRLREETRKELAIRQNTQNSVRSMRTIYFCAEPY